MALFQGGGGMTIPNQGSGGGGCLAKGQKKKRSDHTNFVLNNRKVTRLGIEPRPSGKIPDALTTEVSGLTGIIRYLLFMHLPLQLGILVI